LRSAAKGLCGPLRLSVPSFSSSSYAHNHRWLAGKTSVFGGCRLFEETLAKDYIAAKELYLDYEAPLLEAFGSDAEKLRDQVEVFDYQAALMTVRSILASYGDSS
jgi:hypothetical protein